MIALGACALVASTASYARADEPMAYPECPRGATVSADAAHGAFVAGKASFDAGDYARALTYFHDAYRRDCRKHELLVIIARSYELLDRPGGKREAARALALYLERAPAAPDAPTQREHLSRLQAQIAHDEAEEQALAAKRAASAPPVSPAPATVPATAASSAPAPAADAEDTSSSRGRSAVPLVVGAVGLAGVAAGVPLVVVGSTKVSDADGSCPTRSRCAPSVTSSGNDGSHLRTAGAVLLVSGGAVAVGGLVWFWLQPTHASSASASLSFEPLLAPGLAGLGAQGRF